MASAKQKENQKQNKDAVHIDLKEFMISFGEKCYVEGQRAERARLIKQHGVSTFWATVVFGTVGLVLGASISAVFLLN